MSFPIERYLTVRSCTAPSLSPDGSEVAFLSDLTGLPQAWVVSTRSGWPRQVTFTDHAVRSVHFSPDGAWLLYAMDRDGNERQQLYLVRPDGGETRRLTDRDEAIHTFGHWAPDGVRFSYASTARDPRYFDVYVMDTESATAQPVLEADGTHLAGAFSPDGARLLVYRVRGSLDQDVGLLDLATGQVRWLTSGGMPTRFQDAWWTPDGQGVLLRADLGSDFLYLARLDLADWRVEPLVRDEWDVDGLAVAHDRQLAWTVNEGGVSRLRVGTEVASVVADLPAGVVSGLTWSADGARLAFQLETPSGGADVWTYDRAAAACGRVTFSDRAGLPAHAFVEPELVDYGTFDGRRIPAWWYRPATAPPYPAVLYLHGGPEGQTRPVCNPVLQFLVNHGYAVLAPNVRGSTGYGTDYCHLDDKRLRLDSVEDAHRAVPWLTDHGADPARIACYGGSYGGFMVLSLVTRYPEVWAAGVEFVGIANFVTFLEHTGAYRRKLREAEYGSLEEDGDFLREISPVHRVDQVQCPMFIVQGATDPRVPQIESDQMVEALRARGIPVEYLVFDDEGHGLIKRVNRIAAYTAMAAFLKQHLPTGEES